MQKKSYRFREQITHQITTDLLTEETDTQEQEPHHRQNHKIQSFDFQAIVTKYSTRKPGESPMAPNFNTRLLHNQIRSSRNQYDERTNQRHQQRELVERNLSNIDQNEMCKKQIKTETMKKIYAKTNLTQDDC